MALLGAVLYAAGGLLDLLNVGLDAHMWCLLGTRFAVGLGLVGTASVVVRSYRYRSLLDHLVLAVMMAVAVGTTFIIALSPRGSTAHTVTVLAIVLIFYSLVPVGAINAALAGLFLSGGTAAGGDRPGPHGWGRVRGPVAGGGDRGGESGGGTPAGAHRWV